jgi:hypothetical protein
VPALPLLQELESDLWLQPCVQSARTAIERAGIRRRQTRNLLFAAALLVRLVATVLSSYSYDQLTPITLAALAIAGCVMVGLWLARPGAVASVGLFGIGLAMLLAALLANQLTGQFDPLLEVFGTR